MESIITFIKEARKKMVYPRKTWLLKHLDIDPKATYFDSLAHIFYRLGWHNEALLNQNKAISLAKEQKELTKAQIEGSASYFRRYDKPKRSMRE